MGPINQSTVQERVTAYKYKSSELDFFCDSIYLLLFMIFSGKYIYTQNFIYKFNTYSNNTDDY
jgi:hypothetical protein